MVIAKENDLVSSIYIVKLLYQEVFVCILYLDAKKHLYLIISL